MMKTIKIIFLFVLFPIITFGFLFFSICCQNPDIDDKDINGVWLGSGIHPVIAYENENISEVSVKETLWVENNTYRLVLKHPWVDVYEEGFIEQNKDSLCFSGMHYYEYDTTDIEHSKYDSTDVDYCFPFYFSDNRDTLYGMFYQAGLYDFYPYFKRIK